MLCNLFNDTYIAEILKLTGATEWLEPHIDLTEEKPWTEVILVIEKLLTVKPLKGEELEFIPIDPAEPVEPVKPTPHSTCKKGDVPVSAMLADNLQKLSIEEIRQILSSVLYEMGGRRVPLEVPQSP